MDLFRFCQQVKALIILFPLIIVIALTSNFYILAWLCRLFHAENSGHIVAYRDVSRDVLKSGRLYDRANYTIMRALQDSLPRHILNDSLIGKRVEEFDWISYLHLNSDVAKAGINNREDAFNHFIQFGKKEGRQFPTLQPQFLGYDIALKKLDDFISSTSVNKSVPKSSMGKRQKTFIMYHVGSLNGNDSPDVASNNIALFLNAAKADPVNFYWFNVIGGVNNHRLHGSLRDEKSLPRNIAVVDWPASPSDMYLHFRTLILLQKYIQRSFDTVFFLNHGVRGPIVDSSRLGNGAWLQPFRNLLFSSTSSSKVGMVGSSLSCEGVPHVQTHAFMLLSELVPAVAEKYNKINFSMLKGWSEVVLEYEVGLSLFVVERNYSLASLLYSNRSSKGVFDGSCLTVDWVDRTHPTSNPSRWCDLNISQLIFVKWGGEVLRKTGVVCDNLRSDMRQHLFKVSQELPQLKLKAPETIRGGGLRLLFQQYEQEMWRESIKIAQFTKPNRNGKLKTQPQSHADVCFIVRTSEMHDFSDILTQRIIRQDSASHLEEFIKSMQRQTDPHWQAHFIITDEKPFEARLQSLLAEYRDSRLQYLEVGREARPEYSKQDAGYTATDTALHRIINNADYSSCRWIVVTNADNIYGSAVVSSARQQSPEEFEMLLAPMDSRNIMEQELWQTYDGRPPIGFRCLGLHSTLDIRLLGFAIQSRPQIGRVDLSSVIFSRAKLKEENLFFTNFSDPKLFACEGCQDGYFTEYLADKRKWEFKQLPLDGLKSLVFHGPSPLWCIASGKVWVDHIDHNRARCLSHRTVANIREIDERQFYRVFDWENFDREEPRSCLAGTPFGYEFFEDSSINYALSNHKSLANTSFAFFLRTVEIEE